MDGRSKKITVILVISSIILILLLGVFIGNESHDVQININGDDALITEAERKGWSGDGSLGNPFIISNVKMNLTGSAPCIMLANTTMYVTIKDCELSHRYDDQGSTVGIGIRLVNVKNITLENNVVRSVASGLEVSSCTGLTIMNNAIEGTANGFDMKGSNGNLIVGNSFGTFIGDTFQGQRSNTLLASDGNRFELNAFITIEGTGLLVQSSDSNDFNNNSFQGSTIGAGATRGTVGLVLSESSNNSFYHDRMSGGGYFEIGMSVIDSNDNLISHCQIFGRTGMYVARSSGNDISYNDFNAISTAVDMVDSDMNVLFGNKMDSTFSATGIRMVSCNDNLIVMNSITGHSIASYLIYFDNSSNNLVFNNTFRYQGTEVRMQKLAFDDTGLNNWNDSIFGNYWSDWTTPDLNMDGFVDAPYILDVDEVATDWHPLINPPS